MKNWAWAALGVAAAFVCLATAAEGKGGGGGGGHGGGHGGGGHGGGHGGGSHIIYRTVIIAGVPRTVAEGADETLVFDMTDRPVAAIEGEMKRGDVIARHTVRVSDAIVLDQPAPGMHGEVPAGTVLVRVSAPAKTPVYCDVRPGVKLMWADEYDCYQAHTDGVITILWQGFTPTHFAPFGDNDLEPKLPLKFTAYHAAKDDERPIAQVGYRWCSGDGVTSPPRFAIVVSELNNEAKWGQAGPCAFGVWPTAEDKAHVEFAGLHMDVSPGADGAMKYKVVDRVPAGPLASLEGDDPVITIAQLTAASAAAAARAAAPSGAPANAPPVIGPPVIAQLAPTPRPVITPHVIAPPVVAQAASPALRFARRTELVSGNLGVGDTVANAALKHGLTGKLQNRVAPRAMFGHDTPVEVGQPVYGLPEKDGRVIWCAPRQIDGKADTACFIPTGEQGGYFWLPHRKPALMPFDSLYSLGARGLADNEPSVHVEPVDFPEVKLRILMGAANPPKGGAGWTYRLDVWADSGEGEDKMRSLLYEPAASGTVYDLFGVRARFAPDPKDPTRLVVSPG